MDAVALGAGVGAIDGAIDGESVGAFDGAAGVGAGVGAMSTVKVHFVRSMCPSGAFAVEATV